MNLKKKKKTPKRKNEKMESLGEKRQKKNEKE